MPSPRPPRIAHLTPFAYSRRPVACGGERHVRNLVRSLKRAGLAEQTIFVPGPDEATFEQDGVTLRMLRSEIPTPDAEEAVSSALWRALPGFDLVHVHHSLTTFGAFCLAVARSLGIPVVGTDLGGADSYLLLQRGCVDLLDGALSVSRFAHSRIAAQYHGRHEVLSGPVDTEQFCPAPGAERDGRTVLCVGRITPSKGLDRVIAALPPGLRLVIAGAVQHKAYAGQLRHLAKGRQVRFIHDAEDAALLDLYRSAGLFVQATTACDRDGREVSTAGLMGQAALEAMACGLPVALADTGALPELSPGQEAGRIFADDSELEAILRDFAAGTWPVPQAGSLAREHVVAGYGLESFGPRLAQFYTEVLRDRGKVA